MTGDENFKWWWGYGQYPAFFCDRSFDTRDEAISDARSAHPLGGWLIVEAVEAIKADPEVTTTDIFDSDKILERYFEYNEDCWSPNGPGIAPTREQELELEADLKNSLTAWMDRHNLHGRVWTLALMRNEEYFPETTPTIGNGGE